MGYIPVDCPYCGRKVASVPDKRDCNKTLTCPGCRTRLRIDSDWRTGHISVGRA